MNEIFADKIEKETSTYLVVGGRELSGVVHPGGSKNAAFPILAASILLSEPIRLNNVPHIEDIKCFIEILDSLGANTKRVGENSLEVDPRPITEVNVPHDLGSRIRGSYYFLGALLSRFGKASIPPPGGCKVGDRPMDQHFVALEQIGYQFKIEHIGTVGQRMDGWQKKQASISLPFPSRGATINTLLASIPIFHEFAS